MTTARFAATPKTRIRRLPKRGHYDRATIYAILDAAMIAHIGYVLDGEPFVTPTAYWREGDRLLWHGSAASRMLRAQAHGLPVCLTVTITDGLVLARSGFHHSINYRSVMAFGRSRPVEDAGAKRRAMETFIDRFFPGRAATLRPITSKEIKASRLMSMEIEQASAKIRTGAPIDEEEDYALSVWAGVIPLRHVVGRVERDPRLARSIAPPDDIAAYAEGAHLDDVLRRVYDGSRRGDDGSAEE